jgi:Tol biopolymer transport system component
VLLVAVSITVAVLVFVPFREKPVELHPVRFQILIPDKVRLDLRNDWPVVSPDGRRVAFTGVSPEGRRLLWIHSLDFMTTEALTGTDDAYAPFWSPDSRFVAFFTSANKLKKVDISGGPVQTICDLPAGDHARGTWNQDGAILFATRAMPLRRVSAEGGESQPVLALNKTRRETNHFFPHFLPDGRHFLYAADSADGR